MVVYDEILPFFHLRHYILYVCDTVPLYSCLSPVSALLLASPCCWSLAAAVSVPLAPDRNMSSNTHILLYKIF